MAHVSITSSRGALTAYRVLQASNVFHGGVLVPDANGAFELVRDAHRSDDYLRHNIKPILNVVVESNRTVASNVADSIIRASAGPVEACRTALVHAQRHRPRVVSAATQ